MSLVSRNVGIDTLRFIAVALVLGRHAELCPEDQGFLVTKISTIMHTGGWIGVDLFFVISGYLISGLLFQELKKFNCISVKRFLIRRSFKIYPIFWLFVMMSVIFLPDYLRGENWKKIFIELLFLQNYYNGMWAHTWSLAVEEHFYVALPLLLLVLHRCNKVDYLPVIVFSILVYCLTARLIMTMNGPRALTEILIPTHLRLDSLSFGVLLSYFVVYRGTLLREMVHRYKMIIPLSIVVILPAFVLHLESSSYMQSVGLSMNYVSSGVLLVSSLKLKESILLRIMAYIGKYSYAIYLVHMPLQGICIDLYRSSAVNSWMGYVVLYISASLMLGVLVSRTIEYPILKLRDKFYPSRINR